MFLNILLVGFVVLETIGPHYASPVAEPPKTVCYYESWAHWRAGEGKMELSDIDSSQCTHLVYSFLGINKDTFEVAITDPYLMNNLHDLEQFPQHKGEAKALLGVGGPSASEEFNEMVKTDRSRTAFARSVVNLVEQHNYDGILLHWFHYDMPYYHSNGLVELLKQFHNETFTRRYTLAVAVSAAEWHVEDSKDLPTIAGLVDFINVLTFDHIGFNQGKSDESPFSWQLQVAEYYHKKGAPRAKLVITVPLFARTWITRKRYQTFETKSIVYDETLRGPAGPASRVEGYLSFNELCTMMQSNPNSFTIALNETDFTAMARFYNSSDDTTEYFSFENPKTLAWKAQNITAFGYAGVAVYALDNDDFQGNCGLGKYPLMQAINQNYVPAEKSEDDAVIVVKELIPPERDPFAHINGMIYCRTVGQFRDPLNCSKWYRCEQGDFTLELTAFNCEPNQAFDESTKKCVDRSLLPTC